MPLERILRLAAILALLILNAAIAWPLFHVEYLSQTGTVEGVFIANARYARDHWLDPIWCRFWFAGMPFQNAYVPGLHLTGAALSSLARISAAAAFPPSGGVHVLPGPGCALLDGFAAEPHDQLEVLRGAVLLADLAVRVSGTRHTPGSRQLLLGPEAAHRGRVGRQP